MHKIFYLSWKNQLLKSIFLSFYRLIINISKWQSFFLMGYNGIFNVRSENNKLYFAISVTDNDGFLQITIPPCVQKVESLKIEVKRIIIDEAHFTEVYYPFKNKPSFSTLDSLIDFYRQKPKTSFISDVTIKVFQDLMQGECMRI